MKAEIFAIATAVPAPIGRQSEIGAQLARRLGLSETGALRYNKILARSNIEKRHTVLSDFDPDKPTRRLFQDDLKSQIPTTEQRNRIYREEAPKLALEAAKKALAEWGGDKSRITHVISVSCTGMIAPGLEFLLTTELGLSRQVERLGINFMGCFGAFKALSVAKALAAEDRTRRVLLVCTELCSLHFQVDDRTDTWIANALFADGCAAAVVGCAPQVGENSLWQIHDCASLALDESLEEMTWEAADTGYVMRLSENVPKAVGKNIVPFVKRLLGERTECDYAIHPGGKAILHQVAMALQLESTALEPSRYVLSNYGNMSSPTFLFVLDRLRRQERKEWCVGVGFGPGLSMEGILLKAVQ